VSRTLSTTHRRLLSTLVVLGLTSGALSAGSPAAADDDPVDPTRNEAVDRDRADLEPAPSGPVTPVPAADRVLVRFEPGATARDRRGALAAAGVGSADAVGSTGFVAVPTGDADPQEVVDELADDPLVAQVQLDHVRTAAAWTDDEYLEYTWPYLDLVRLPRAWDETTGAGTTVAVLDTGIRTNHQDLTGTRVLPGYDFVVDKP
jgi:subtilisin family serine protease